jgi:hypothetical protein
MIGACTLPLGQLMDDAPHPDAETGLYDPEEDGKHETKTFAVSLLLSSCSNTDGSYLSRPPKRFLGNPNTRQYSTSEPSTNPTMPFDKSSGDNTLLNTMSMKLARSPIRSLTPCWTRSARP